jgi:hypothetical protein
LILVLKLQLSFSRCINSSTCNCRSQIILCNNIRSILTPWNFSFEKRLISIYNLKGPWYASKSSLSWRDYILIWFFNIYCIFCCHWSFLAYSDPKIFQCLACLLVLWHLSWRVSLNSWNHAICKIFIVLYIVSLKLIVSVSEFLMYILIWKIIILITLILFFNSLCFYFRMWKKIIVICLAKFLLITSNYNLWKFLLLKLLIFFRNKVILLGYRKRTYQWRLLLDLCLLCQEIILMIDLSLYSSWHFNFSPVVAYVSIPDKLIV